jgi:hypothetical protein
MRVLALSIVLVAAGAVHADDLTQRRADADKLFEQALQLRAQGDETRACVKFTEALEDNPEAIGSVLNVALCNEETGKFATAVKLFRRARRLAVEHQLAAQRNAADEHLAKDEPLVGHVTLAFAEVPGVHDALLIDQQLVPLDSVQDIELDPGRHQLSYSAPGRVSYDTSFELDKGAHQRLAIPRLAAMTARPTNTRKVVGLTLGASGVALIAGGIAIGLVARSHYNAPFDTQPDDTTTGHCDASGRCNQAGLDHIAAARSLGWVGTGVGIAGVVAVSAGAVLWFSHRHEHGDDHVAVVPAIAPGQAGIAAVGRF